VFDDPDHVVLNNYYIDGEQREQAIGLSCDLLLLLVVFVDRSTDEENTSIISARKADAYEESIYEGQFRQANQDRPNSPGGLREA
jgi:uncharacterized DUF497 family protein